MGIGDFISEKFKIDKDMLPKHVAFVVKGSKAYAKKKNLALEQMRAEKFGNIKETIQSCVKLNIPICTFYLLPATTRDESEIVEIIDALVDFFKDLSGWTTLQENQVKISVLGKWYDLPGRLVDKIKSVLEDTKDYDKFFVNFCINYDGQEEIVDACRLIVRQIAVGRITPEAIDKGVIKENIYSSYFLPPDLLVKTGTRNITDGLLLWDSAKAKIYFANKTWPEFTRSEFLKALEWHQK